MALAAGILAGCAWFGPPAPARVEHGRLVDQAGMSLYTFDRDKVWARESRCTGDCAQRFPPFTAPPGAQRITEYRVLARPGGASQWTFKGRPLYLFSGDRKPGDVEGDGNGNLWRVARP